jgi:hypothetical protein
VNKIILNLQRPLWEGDQEVVKRSGRDEPMWDAIHKYIEAMLRISLYSYLYSHYQNYYVFLIISYIFYSTKLENKRAEQVLLGSGGVGEGGPNNVYTCK